MLMNTKIIMLQGAMDLETELLIASLEQPQEYLLGQWRFVEGIYKDKPLVIAATSIGSANAAAAKNNTDFFIDFKLSTQRYRVTEV